MYFGYHSTGSGSCRVPRSLIFMVQARILGNDNHTGKFCAATPARDTKNQAYGSAVLFVGNTDGADTVPGRINIKVYR